MRLEILLLALMTAAGCLSMGCMSVEALAGRPSADEVRSMQQWTKSNLNAKAAVLPFSFTYGGRPSSALLSKWRVTESAGKIEKGRTRRTMTWQDPETGLEVRCVVVEYQDFPTVEWTLYFKNAGSKDSPIIESIQSLNTTFQKKAQGEFLLHHNVGSPANGNDYGPLETVMGPGVKKRIGAAGGRPTNSDMSYFNLEWCSTEGMIVVVGWPGQWAAEFARGSGNDIKIAAGQELTHFKLLPGEEVRSPLTVLQYWNGGDWIRAQNIWRQWMFAYNVPRPGGSLPPVQFLGTSGRAYIEMTGANEQNQIAYVKRFYDERIKLDYWWMDAGWYVNGTSWPNVGTWEVDPQRFPKGFKPISDYAHAHGTKILVWFEPERVAPGTWLYENRREWLLSGSPGNDMLAGLRTWTAGVLGGTEPHVACNPTSQVRSTKDIRWEPGRLSFHPGPKGEYSVVRWTAPEAGEHTINATFLALDQSTQGTTTDVHVLLRGYPLYDGWISRDGRGMLDLIISVAKGDAVDFVVGRGRNGNYFYDSTGLEAQVRSPSGKIYDAAKEFDVEHNPAGPWSYGWLKPGPSPDSSTFRAYDRQGRPGAGTRLLNLGDPAARQWLTDHIDKLLTDNGIDLYRQDFNMDPLDYWRQNDPPDRQGITENKHVVGYLAYWDELRRRHPNMLIDSCASGGRRNDLETMRRAVPLWRSDYAFEANGHQCMTYGISMWIPFQGTGTVATKNAPYYGGGYTDVEPYYFWSNASPSLVSGVDMRVKEINYDLLRKLIEQWRQIGRNYYGDFYPLTPWTRDAKAWMAWQFDCPGKGEGAIQAFRRSDCPEVSKTLKLRGLDANARYKITNLGNGNSRMATGAELMGAGLTVQALEKPPVAVILIYSKVK